MDDNNIVTVLLVLYCIVLYSDYRSIDSIDANEKGRDNKVAICITVVARHET
jgi:hypothetical protein